MSQFIKNNNDLRVVEDGSLNIVPKCPLGTYIVNRNPQTGEFYLSKILDFTQTGKVYGDHPVKSDRIINTFLSRPNNTGVLLSGVKGTGKTLLVKEIANTLQAEHQISTVIISRGYDSRELAVFLRSITEPMMIIFDEFDKNFARSFNGDSDSSGQEGLLDLLDGIFENKKLYIFCCNKLRSINDYFLSRPGRIFYHFKFDGITPEVISEYCDDNLANSKFKEQIVQLGTMINDFTFDILKALVEECNRYNEAPMQSLSILNVDLNTYNRYSVEVIDNRSGKIIINRNAPKDDQIQQTFSITDPQSFNFWIHKRDLDKVSPDLTKSLKAAKLLDSDCDVAFEVKPSEMVSFKPEEIIFVNSKYDFTIKLIKVKSQSEYEKFNYYYSYL